MTDKRQQLVETALRLFYQKGIHAVGINEVLKQSGVAKKTLYHHFSSKQALIVAALEMRDQIMLEWLEQWLSPARNDMETVTRLFSALSQWFSGQAPGLMPFRGCFFINTAAEFGDDEGSEAISQCCSAHKQRERQLIRRYLSDKSDELLDGLCLLKEGAIVSAYLNKDLLAAEKCIPLARQLYT